MKIALLLLLILHNKIGGISKLKIYQKYKPIFFSFAINPMNETFF